MKLSDHGSQASGGHGVSLGSHVGRSARRLKARAEVAHTVLRLIVALRLGVIDCHHPLVNLAPARDERALFRPRNPARSDSIRKFF